MNICDIEIVEDIERLRNGKIVLYGTGDWGKRVNKELKSLNMNVSHVVKTIAWKGETFEDDVEVEQISAIASQINNSQYVIIIASQIYGEEMMAHLDSLGICAKDGAKILTLRAFNTAVLVNIKRTVAPPQRTTCEESKEKIALYKEVHQERPQYGVGAVHFLPMVSCFIDYIQPKTVLDYGCGKGLLVEAIKSKYPSITSVGYDPAIPGRDSLTVDRVDFLTCTDVLEHIPEEDLPAVIEKISSLSSNCFFALHHGEAVCVLPNGENAHCTVKPTSWYYELFRRYFKHVICLPIDAISSVMVTFDVSQEVKDAYMKVLASGLFI